MDKPLNWGLCLKDYPDYCEYFPQHTGHKGLVTIKQENADEIWSARLQLTVMPGDCGTLLLNGASDATEEGLKKVAEVASMNGFDTIYATLVNRSKQVKLFEKAGWKICFEGYSNRKHNVYNKVGLVLHLTDCKFKGYSGD